MCGPVTYNITVMPSHGMIMMTNETVYNIIGLNYNTTYTITVYANNDHTSGEPTAITVKTKPLPAGKYNCIIIISIHSDGIGSIIILYTLMLFYCESGLNTL